MFTKPCRIRQTLEQRFDAWQIHDFMNKNVRAFRKLGQLRRISSVARNDHRTVFSIEAVCIRLFDWWMTHKTASDSHVLVRQHEAGLTDLVSCNEGAWVGTALIYDSGVDIKFQIIKKVARHLCQPWWTAGIQANWQTSYPRVIDQRP